MVAPDWISIFVEPLDRLQIIYMITGSVGAMAYAEPWATIDIDTDPLFVDPDNGDVRLSPGSPCIDAGLNAAVPPGITTDLDGNPRFIDAPDTPDCPQAPGACGDPPVVDMGAFEFRR